jgi:hypothetical protein
VLVIGIPAALIAFIGYPLPRTAPSKDWLTTTMSATFIINVLACIMWLVWGHFVICLLAEWRAVRRGRLPSVIPLGGGSQLIARRLVATALLLVGAATAIPHSSFTAPTSAAPSRVAVAVVAPRVVAAVDHVMLDQATTLEQSAVSAKYYTVNPPDGRRYDSLWDIADRTLGDPLRYKEIFALNKDRTQVDGGKIMDANLIRPGWELRLPADASGPGVRAVNQAVPPVQAHAGSDTATGGTMTAALTVPVQSATDVTTPDSSTAGQTAEGIDLSSVTFGGAMMLAGILLALRSRRGPYADESAAEAQLGAATDPELPVLLDYALRGLGWARTAQGLAMPRVALAWASEDRIVLQLAGGDMSEPPSPWHMSEDGGSWTFDPSEDSQENSGSPAPFPGLVSVGHAHGFELFFDLEQAPGMIAVGGDTGRARELVTALAVQAATSIWSDGVRVTLVGFGDGAELAQLAPALINQSTRLDEVLDTIEQDEAGLLELQRRLGVDGIWGGRQADRHGPWRPHLVVLSGPPTPEESVRMQRLISSQQIAVVGLVVGDAPGARWRFAIDAAGKLDLGVLGATAQANRLGRAETVHLTGILAQARDDIRRQVADVESLDLTEAVARCESAVTSLPLEAAAVSVFLLGRISVDAPGPVDPQKIALLTEIVVAGALHDGGLHDAVLRALIWPRGVGDDVVAATLADAQAWLGFRPDGSPRLARDDDGRWQLSRDVHTDWQRVIELATHAGGPDELQRLTTASALFGGEAFSGVPAGRYGWMAFAREAREARVLGTTVARRAAALHVLAGQAMEAGGELSRGLLLVPESELLWRDLLALTSRDDLGAAASVAEDMYRELALRQVQPQPETDALVQQVLPGFRLAAALSA